MVSELSLELPIKQLRVHAIWIGKCVAPYAVRSRAGCAETGAEQFYFSPLYAWLGELSERPAFVMIGKWCLDCPPPEDAVKSQAACAETVVEQIYFSPE